MAKRCATSNSQASAISNGLSYAATSERRSISCPKQRQHGGRGGASSRPNNHPKSGRREAFHAALTAGAPWQLGRAQLRFLELQSVVQLHRALGGGSKFARTLAEGDAAGNLRED